MLTLFYSCVSGQNFFWSHAGAVTTDTCPNNLLKDTLFAIWDFDETSGTTSIDGYAENDLTITGATINQTGKIGKAYSFDGDSDWVYSSSNIITSAPLTISFWVSVDSLSTNRITTNWVSTAYCGIEVGFDYNQLLFAFYNCGGTGKANRKSYVLANTPEFGTWYHVVAVCRGFDDFDYYVNGVEKTLSHVGGTASVVNFSSGQFYVGRVSASTSYSPDGLIDQVAVWERALSSDEVSILYNSGDGLVYSCWDGELDSCLDASLVCEKTLNFTPVSDQPFTTDGIGPNIAEDSKYIFIVFNNSLEEDYKYHTVWRYNKSTGDTASITITTENSYYGDNHKSAAQLVTSSGSLIVAIEQLPGNNNHNAEIEIFRWNDTDSLQNYTSTVVGNTTTQRLAYPFLYEIKDSVILEARRYSTVPPYRVYYKSTDDGQSFGSMNEYITYGDTDYWIYKIQARNNFSSKDSVILAIMPSNHDYGYNIFQYITYLKTGFDGNFYALDGTDLGTNVSGAELVANYSWGNTTKNDSLFYPQGSKLLGDYIYLLGYIGKMPTSTVNVSQMQVVKVNVNTGAVTSGSRFNTKFSSTDMLSTVLFNMCGTLCAKIIKSGTIYYYKIDDDLNDITLIHSESGNYTSYSATNMYGELTADYDSSTKKVRIFRFSDPDGL